MMSNCLLYLFFFGIVLKSVKGIVTITFETEEEITGNVYLGSIAAKLGANETEIFGGNLESANYNILKSGDVDYSDYFDFNPATSDFYLKQKVDREEVCQQSEVCKMRAILFGNSGTVTEFVNINVTVKDINDNIPTFSESVKNLYIPEGTSIRTSYTLTPAIDLDSGINAIQEYILEPSRTDFELEKQQNLDGSSTLNLILNLSLDRESTQNYTLYVKAVDGGTPPFTGTLTVNINVTDKNDNRPIFQSTEYNATIDEDVEINTVVITVSAIDRDIGENSRLAYYFADSVSSNIRQYFGIKETSGNIFVKETLESTSRPFIFFIEVKDHGDPMKKSQAKVTINIRGKNDNRPVIEMSPPSNISIKENLNIGTHVALVIVWDEDWGLNGEADCECLNSNFTIMKANEVAQNIFSLVSAVEFDRELQAFYTVEINCSDKGQPPLSSNHTFIVTITDENDHTPIFAKNIYTVDILENISVGAVFEKVQATDRDIDLNGKIVYEIEPFAESNMFEIDPDGGHIKAAERFDRETEDEYYFIVTARDQGPNKRSATAQVIVQVKDVNDNSPAFIGDSYAMSILENSNISNSLGTVTATDADLDDNGKVSYMIPAKYAMFPFAILDDGTVITTEVLDREVRDYYHFNVVASDHGNPPRTSSVPVFVTVLDQNDNAPIVEFPYGDNDTVTVAHDTGPDSVIASVVSAKVNTMPAVSKRQRNLRLCGFKKGVSNVHRGKKRTYVKHNTDKRYIRLPKQSYESRIHEYKGIFTFKDVDGTDTNAVPLRSSAETRTLSDDYSVPDNMDVHPDLLTNRLYRPLELNQMFNSEIKMHCIGNNACTGDLIIDASVSRKWGICWYERLKCSKCNYKSKFYQLFEHVDSNVRGRKSAKANLGLQLGAMTTPVGNTGLVRILANTNITPPAKNSMRLQSNSVGKAIVELNKNNMHELRQKLKAENKACGNKNPEMTNVEGDSCYNNPLFNADSTPFQAGTIVTTTMCENNTRNKQIIGAFVGVKICKIASELRNKGETVVCPNHRGHCTASLAESDSIGNESRWNSQVATEINHDLSIAHFTGDGDSKGHSGVDKGQSKPVSHLKDIRHLSNSMRRQINKAKFSKNMFSGPHMANLQSRLSLSIRSRCVSELKKAHSVYQGNIEAIKGAMHNVTLTIILCFKGNCGESCKKYSFVCPGNFKQSKNYLPANLKLKMTKSDEATLYSCIQVLLGPNSIELTKLQTSTQKCEAVNRAYTSCMPKSVTYSRNCLGRIHGQILKLNHGYTNSTLLKSQCLGASLPKGTLVIKHLLKSQKLALRLKSKQCQKKMNDSRYASRMRSKMMSNCLLYLFFFGIVLKSVKGIVTITFETEEEITGNVFLGNIAAKLGANETEIFGGNLEGANYNILKSGDVDYSDYFDFNPATSDFYLKQKVDREEVCQQSEVCKMRVILFGNSGTVTEFVNINVTVKDINDNIPTFSESVKYLYIPEGTAIRTSYTLTPAIDLDSGINAIQEYILEPSRTDFELEEQQNLDGSSTLNLILNLSLDRESTQHYTLYVKAVDGGTPSFTGTLTVNISVTDKNDNRPIFQPTEYNATIDEDVEIDTVVITVSAIDRDIGENSRLAYYFADSVSSNIRQYFGIKETSGNIFVKERLELAKGPFIFFIEVKDHGDPMKKSQAKVTINIRDKNNNRPVIEMNPSSNIKIQENLNIGTHVALVIVSDEDKGLNREADCECLNSNFTIMKASEVAQNTFSLVSAVEFDRELQAFYTVEINCSDKGQPPLSSNLTFNVTIIDEYDPVIQMSPSSNINIKSPSSSPSSNINIKSPSSNINIKGNLNILFITSLVSYFFHEF
ncbi:uncharacterized protein LOC128557329 [Mercenaria mercenaria]|uniref:uncharacterized protein LOC128557329 n=1 Tax=Mercenaria mercenaria TaxID=6596 RepID=UPI00234F55C8|nr:uncharacterized protein LOC128557329 [Mercenaria mercenaria]